MKKKKRNNWPLIVTILAFTISLLFSFMSESVMPKVGIIVGNIAWYRALLPRYGAFE